MGRWHAHEIRRVGGRVAAVIDRDLSRARALADRVGSAAALTDLDALTAESRTSVVHVCTPSGSHEPVVEQALEGGRHVLVEKPLAIDAPTTERLVAEAEERGLLLGAVHQFPFQRGIRRLLRDRDRFGPLLHLAGEARSAGAEGRQDFERDRIACEILPHFLALTRHFVPDRFETLNWEATRPMAGELLVAADANGTSVRLLVSMGGRPPVNRWTVIGRHGAGHADLFHGYSVIEPGDSSRRWKAARPFVLGGVGLAAATGNLLGRLARRQPAYPGLRELIASFYGAATRGEASPVPAAEIVQVARTLDVIKAQLA